jgi:hypothetical protein
LFSLWSADHPGQKAGPSTTLLERTVGCLSLSPFGGPSGPGGQTVRIRRIEFGQGQCVFETLYYRPSGIFSRTVSGPCADRPAMNVGHSARVTLTDQRSVIPSSKAPNRLALEGGPSGLDFSDSSDRFQTVDIAVTGTTDHPTIGRGPSACAQKLC